MNRPVIRGRVKVVQQAAQFGAGLFELLPVHCREFFQFFLADAAEPEKHLSAVLAGQFSLEEIFGGHAVHQADGAVMPQAQTLGQFANGHTVAPGKTLDGQHRLVLLGSQSDSSRGLFAEMDESPERVPKRRESFILGFAEAFDFGHRPNRNRPWK